MAADNIKSDLDWVLDHQSLFADVAGADPQILELGCGPGRDTQNLTRLGTVCATDINPEYLQSCAQRNPEASIVCMDLAKAFPFADRTFSVIVASLSLHYFSWATTLAIEAELRRCVKTSGVALIRVNSTNDTNYGAKSTDQIEPHYYRVNGQTKRFFDMPTLRQLFSNNWHIQTLQESTIDRYRQLKCVWTVILRAQS